MHALPPPKKSSEFVTIKMYMYQLTFQWNEFWNIDFKEISLNIKFVIPVEKTYFLRSCEKNLGILNWLATLLKI